MQLLQLAFQGLAVRSRIRQLLLPLSQFLLNALLLHCLPGDQIFVMLQLPLVNLHLFIEPLLQFALPLVQGVVEGVRLRIEAVLEGLIDLEDVHQLLQRFLVLPLQQVELLPHRPLAQRLLHQIIFNTKS